MDIRSIVNKGQVGEVFESDGCGYIRKPHPEYQPLIDYYNSIMYQYWKNHSSYRLRSMACDFLVADLSDLTKRMIAFLNEGEGRITIGLLNFMSGLTIVKSHDESVVYISHEEYPTLFSYWKLLELMGGDESFFTAEKELKITPKAIMNLQAMSSNMEVIA